MTSQHARALFGSDLENTVFKAFCDAASDECQRRILSQDVTGKSNVLETVAGADGAGVEGTGAEGASAESASGVGEGKPGAGSFILRADELSALAGERGLQRTILETLGWRSGLKAQDMIRRDGKKDRDEQHDLPTVVVNEVFLEALGSLLGRYGGKGLSLETLEQIEDVAASQLASIPSTSHAAMQILKLLSKHHLVRVTNKIRTTAFSAANASKSSIPQLLITLGELDLDIQTSEQVIQATQCLRVILEIESSAETKKKCKSCDPPLKHVLCKAIFSLLSQATDTPRSLSLNYEAWDEGLCKLWSTISTWASKTKHQLPALPLLARILQLVPDALFDAKAATFLRSEALGMLQLRHGGAVERLLRGTHISRPLREEGVKCFALVAKSVLLRPFALTPQTRTVLSAVVGDEAVQLSREEGSEKAVAVTLALFLANGSPLRPKSHIALGQVGWALEARGSAAVHASHYALDGTDPAQWLRLLLQLLQGSAEQVLCGVLALEAMLPAQSVTTLDHHRQNQNNPPSDMPDITAMLLLGSASESAPASNLSELASTLSAAYGEVLARLDSQCAPSLLCVVRGDQDTPQRNDNVDWPKDVAVALRTLEAALASCPRVMPPWPVQRVISMLALHTQNPSKAVRDQANQAVRRLVLQHTCNANAPHSIVTASIDDQRPSNNNNNTSNSNTISAGVDESAESLGPEALRELSAACIAMSHRAPKLFPTSLQRLLALLEEWHARLEAREATPPGSASELERARARANSKQTPHDAEHWTKWVESAGVLALCCAEEEARARGLRLLFMASTIRSQARLSASSGGGGCAAVAALVVAAMEECKRRSEASEGCDDAYDFCARQDRDLHSSSSSSSSASAVAGGSDATLLSLLEMSKRRRGVHSEEWPGLVFALMTSVVRSRPDVAHCTCPAIRLRTKQLLARVKVQRGNRKSLGAGAGSGSAVESSECEALQTLACAALPAAASAWPGCPGDSSSQVSQVWSEQRVSPEPWALSLQAEEMAAAEPGELVKRLIAASLQDLREIDADVEERRRSAMVALGHGFSLPVVGAVVLQFLASLDAVKVKFTNKKRKLARRRQILHRRLDVYMVMAGASPDAVPKRQWDTLMERLLDLVLDISDHLASTLEAKDEDPDPPSLRLLAASLQALLTRAAPLFASFLSPASWTVALRRRVFDLLLQLQRLHPAEATDQATAKTGPPPTNPSMQRPSLSAALALASLLNGPAFDVPVLTNQGRIDAKSGPDKRMECRLWINGMVCSSEEVLRRCGLASLGHYLTGNLDAVHWSLACAFSTERQLARSHCIVLARLLLHQRVSLGLDQAMVLGLVFVGDCDDNARRAAGAILEQCMPTPCQFLSAQLTRSEGASPESIQHQQVRLSEIMARACIRAGHSAWVNATVACFFKWILRSEGVEQQRAMLLCLAPWLRRQELATLEGGARGWVADLLLMTHQLASILPGETQELWTAASSPEGNLDACLRMLHSLAVSSLSQPTTSSPPKPRNIAVISALQTAVIGVFRHSRTLTFEWMADSLSAAPGIEELCCTVDANLSPSLFVAQQHRPIEDIVEPGGDGGRARGKSKADVALVLLSSVINCMIPIQDDHERDLFRRHAPTLLHAAVSSSVGSGARLVSECSKQIIAAVLRGLAMSAAHHKSDAESEDMRPASPISSEFLARSESGLRGGLVRTASEEYSDDVEGLISKVVFLPSTWASQSHRGVHDQTWDSAASGGTDREGKKVLNDMLAVVDGDGRLREAWGREALDAACFAAKMDAGAMRRMCDSHQAYRCLAPAVRCEDAVQVLRTLAQVTVVEGGGAERRRLQAECVQTLLCMVTEIEACKLILVPQLFWGTVALLHTSDMVLYQRAIALLEALLQGLNLADRCAQNILFTSAPQDWMPPYNGITPLVLPGLCHAPTHVRAASLLHRIINQQGGMVLDPTPRHMLMCIVALLPVLLESVDHGRGAEGPVGCARALKKACENRGLTRLHRVFDHLSRPGHFASASAAMQDIAAPLQEALFGSNGQVHAIEAALHLASQAQGAPAGLRRYALRLLLVVIKGDRRSALAGVRETVAAKLLPLLQGDLRAETLEALHAIGPAPA